MLEYEKEKNLFRILSGKTILAKMGLDVITPSLDLLYESEEIYCEYFKKKSVLTQEEIRLLLVHSQYIKIDDINYLKDYSKVLESLQKELCSNFYTHNADSIRSLIKQAKSKKNSILNKLAKYEGYSLENLANYAKSIFLISNTVYKNSTKYDFSEYNQVSIISELNNNIISNDDIRDIAKNSSWCNTWYTLRGNTIFQGVPSIEQQLLLMWSKIYDNIRESQDSPTEEMILDNDAIDGWLLLQKDQNNRKKLENSSSLKSNSKINNAQEVFIVVDKKKPLSEQKEQIDRIQSMNSKIAQNIQKQRIEQIYSKGSVNHHDLIDVRREVQEQFHKMQLEHIRGKKT